MKRQKRMHPAERERKQRRAEADRQAAATVAARPKISVDQINDGRWEVRRDGRLVGGPYPTSAAAWRKADSLDATELLAEDRRRRIAGAFAER